MVRMRDVLKSVRDMTRTGTGSSQDEQNPGMSFPQSGGAGFGQQRSNVTSSFPDTTVAGVTPDSIPDAEPDQAEIAEPSVRKASMYHDSISVVHNLLTQASGGEKPDLVLVEEKAEALTDSLLQTDHLYLQSLSARRSLTTMAQHSVHVAIIAIKVAIGLKYTREQIVEVGLTGLVHEIGMMKVPNEILMKKGELSPSEYELIKQHPIHGKNLLEEFKESYPFLPEAVMQEHERWNGKGYPLGLKEEEIHPYAQIIGLADTFVALTHLRHYRDNFIAYKAMQSIIERRNIDFSAKLIKALIEVISIFPVHSLIKLNDGRVARVVETNKQYPVRPVIDVIRDAKGEDLHRVIRLDLSREPMIYIVSPVLDEGQYS